VKKIHLHGGNGNAEGGKRPFRKSKNFLSEIRKKPLAKWTQKVYNL
jgi:hypothetical protein